MLRWLSRLLGHTPPSESPHANQARPSGMFAQDAVVDGVPLRIHLDTQTLALDAEVPHRAQLRARLPKGDAAFVSGSVLATKAKVFDDGIYAAVELLVQRDAGKQAMLEAVRSAHPLMAAACELGGGSAVEPRDTTARAMLDEFLGNALASKPISFYTWSDDLTRIFRQDRMLQRIVEDPRELEPLVDALHANPDARAAYERALRIAERLTNPLAREDLRSWLASRDRSDNLLPRSSVSVLPPSIAHETKLIGQLYGNRPIPDGFDLADEMIRAIRDGRIDLAPKPESGFYDWQTWALETLAAPMHGQEKSRLVLMSEYSKHLEAMFRGLIALTRETHAKQLEVLPAGCAPMRPPTKKQLAVVPMLTVEPLATYYARRAEGYRFVRALLEEELGNRRLADARRLTAAGPVDLSLAEEVVMMERLFAGAAQRSLVELGLAKPADDGAEEALRRFEAEHTSDADLSGDQRMMVPVYFDVARRKTKVWAFLGWQELRFEARHARLPAIEFVRPGDAENYELTTGTFVARIATPVMVEVLTSRILDRREMRALCDERMDQAAIVEALEKA